MIYRCCEPQRRRRVLEAIADGAALNGIDFLEVLDRELLDLEPPVDTPRQRTLLLRFLTTAPDLPLDSFELTGGERVVGVSVLWRTRADAPDLTLVEPSLDTYLQTLDAPEQVLVLRTSSTGDHSTYTLRLVASPGSLAPPNEIDRLLSQVDFSFKVECPSDFDCAPAVPCPEDTKASPEISYLAKDYQSFRRMMLSRMAQIMPDWRERNPADLGVTLVETLAYTADRLSYAQDAASTEAYLASARLRSSIRRHARLVDYRMHDGANARVWLQLDVDAPTTLPEDTQFLTRLVGVEPTISGTEAEREARNRNPLIFETMAEYELFPSLNAIDFYDWGNEECCLPRGATRATLERDLTDLVEGAVLIFEERLGPRTGRKADADLGKRHAVRLTKVENGLTDELTGTAITEIRWAEEDALPFPVCISSAIDETLGGGLARRVSHALGNVVLADHGETIRDEALGSVPEPHLFLVREDGDDPCAKPPPRPVPPRFRPALQRRDITQSALLGDPQSAFAATHIGLAARRADVTLLSGSGANEERWTTRPDLLQSRPGDQHIVVEVEREGRAFVRLGDGRNGRRPNAGQEFRAEYRSGNGTVGNVGRDAIRHAFTGLATIRAIRNPLPATGGVNPESMEEVRQAAPYAYRRQERAVTPEDYAAMAERFPDVQRAAASFRWNGHGHTVFITVDRREGRPITAEYEAGIRAFLDTVRMAGYDLEIDGPRFVAVELELFICAGSDHFRSEIHRAAFEALGTGRLVDGSRGFFHPDNFSFGQTLYLSQIYARLMEIEGIVSVEAKVFRRRGSRDTRPLLDGSITFGRLEIAQLDNDPNFPERGTFSITMGGGK